MSSERISVEPVYYEPPGCSAAHCNDPMCPYPHFGAWFVSGHPESGYHTKDEALRAARAGEGP